MTIDEALKKEVFDYLYLRVPGFKPDVWGKIVLEGEQGDYTEIVVAGYVGEARRCYVLACYCKQVKEFYEIIKKPY